MRRGSFSQERARHIGRKTQCFSASSHRASLYSRKKPGYRGNTTAVLAARVTPAMLPKSRFIKSARRAGRNPSRWFCSCEKKMKEKGEVWQDGTSNAALFQPRVPMVTSSYSDLIRSGKDWQQHYTTVSGALFRHSASL